ncbi:MAG: acyl-CoA dehydrogenase [Gordonia sp. (in: high G+C Gram-positive bacteria)]
MDFTLPDAVTELTSLTADIATTIGTDEHLAALAAADAPLDDALWRALAAAGLLALELPVDLVGDAGAGLSIVESAAVAEQLGRSLARVPFGAHAMAATPVLARHGTPTLRQTWLARAATGVAVLAVAVEEHRTHICGLSAPHTALARTGDGWSLAGSKVNVAYAGAADALVVTATGPDGPCVIVVPADATGVTITDTPVTGTTPTAVVDFDDVAIDAAAILDGGATAVTELVHRYTLAVCADQRGTLSRALELTSAYAAEREQFGRAIGSFQAVAQRLADGYIDVQALSLTTTQALWRFTQACSGEPDDLTTAVATAKFWACEAGHRVAHTTIHVHGGVGLDTSHPVHRFFLRAKQNEFTLGAAPIALATIGEAVATR